MMTDDSLHGRVVLSSDGHAIGEVEHFLIEDGKLALTGLEIKVRRNVAERLHIPHGRLRAPTIQISSDQVHSVGDVVILEVPLDSLAATAPNA